MPYLKGTMVTLDALHCTEEVVELTVNNKGGNILLCIKNNRKILIEKIKSIFEKHDTFDIHHECDKKHGREEERTTEVLKTTPEVIGYPHIYSIARVTRKRKVKTKLKFIKETEKTVYYISSLKNVHSKKLHTLIRNHWGIENKLHYKKDVVMNEDRYRANSGVSRIMAAIRSITILILSTSKQSLKVVQRKMSLKPYKVIQLITSQSLNLWTGNFLK